jgi:sterol desaturase/sphingolipid hydroxylase (fatty acid hydroxylase superfamily)
MSGKELWIMAVTPMAVTFLVLSLLATIWLAARERVTHLNFNEPFHISALKRDRRKARFYAQSVWAGLVAAFVGLLALDIAAGTVIESQLVRNDIVGVAYGIGLWGVLVIAMVWSQVAARVGQPNSDGQSLTPLPKKEKNRG